MVTDSDGVVADGTESDISHGTLERFIDGQSLIAKDLKNVDPARISQVTEETRDAFYSKLNEVVALIHRIDSVHCPWPSARLT